MSDEFNRILKEAKKGTAEEKIDALASIIEDMMHIVLEMPGIFDEIVDELNDKIAGLETRLNNFNRIQKTEPPQVKPLPPPPPPIEEKEKTTLKSVSTKKLIMDELKELFAKKKGIEKKQELCKECKFYEAIDDTRGKCFGKEVLANNSAANCPTQNFQSKN